MAIASRDETEATLARSNFFLALARWEGNRPGDAVELLERIPAKHRHVEWQFARQQFNGDDFVCYDEEELGCWWNSVCFSPEGSKIVSGSGTLVDSNNTMKLWDAATGMELRTFDGHRSGARSVSVSPDGTQIVSASHDKSIKLWDTTTEEELRKLSGHTNNVLSVTLSPDGTQLVSGSLDNTVKVWCRKVGQELSLLNGIETVTVLPSTSFSPDSLQMLTTDERRNTDSLGYGHGKEVE